MSPFNRKSMDGQLSEHANRARQIHKIFNSRYKRSFSHNSPALSEFSVDLIDTKNWASKFNQVDQKNRDLNVWKKVLIISPNDVLKRLDFKGIWLPIES